MIRPRPSASALPSNANVFVFTSWIASTSGGDALGVLGLDDALELPVRVADDAAERLGVVTVDRDHGGGGPGPAVSVDQARDQLGGDQRVIAVHDHDRLRVADEVERRPHRAAGSVGLRLDRRSRCPPGGRRERSRSGETITQTRPAPASRAASTGQAIIGRPQIGCSTFGTDERIRVPSPAAMINTVGPLTFGIVERRRP